MAMRRREGRHSWPFLLPDELKAIAWLDEMVMAVRHRGRPIVGVQFHPESVLTPMGGRLLANVLGRHGGTKARRHEGQEQT